MRPYKGIDHYIAMRNLHIEDAIPSEPLDIHSSGRVLIHGFNSFQNQAGEIVSFYETLINKESTSSKPHPIIRWVPHNEIPPTKLIFLRLRDLHGHHGFLYHFPGGLPSKCLTFLCGISASWFFGGSYDLKT